MPARRSAAAVVRPVALVVLYAAIVVWLTWPLGARIASRLPAVQPATTFDTLYAGWVLAHETHALATDPGAIADANIFHPTKTTLFYGPTAIGALPIFAPVFLVSGNPTLALNVAFLLAVATTAAALHWVVRRWSGEELAGLVAAWIFLTTRYVLWEWLPTAPHAAVLGYFPLVVFLTARGARRTADVALLAALIALQCLTEVTYVAPALLGCLGLVALGQLVRSRTRPAGLRLVAALVLACLALVPLAAGYAAVVRANPKLREQTLWHHGEYPMSLPWGPFETYTPYTIAPLVLVLIALGAAVRAYRRRDERLATGAWAHPTYWALIGLLVSLTPVMTWDGRPVRLPQAWLGEWLSVQRFLRSPSRLGMVGLLGVALLGGVAFAECARLARRLRAAWLVPILASVALVAIYVQYAEGFSWPFRRPALRSDYPLQVAIDPTDPILRSIRDGRGPLLELPTNRDGRPAPDLNAAAMYRSIFHRRPLLNGYSSYYPATFPAIMTLANQLPSAVVLARLRQQTGLSAILVHLPLLPPIAQAQWLAVGQRPDLRLVASNGTDLLFAVPGDDGGVS